VSKSVASLLETDVLDHVEGDLEDGYAILRFAWDKDGLDVLPEFAGEIANALTDLANSVDDQVEHGRIDAEEKSFLRGALKSLNTLSSRVRSVGK
jgi:hypothetical protein